MTNEQLALMRVEGDSFEREPRHQLPTLRDLAAALFRQRTALLTTFAAVIIAVIASGIWIPRYEAQMKILVRRQRSDAIVTSSANPPPQFFGDQVSTEDLNSEVEIINSEDLLRQVVRTTGLAHISGTPNEQSDDLAIAKAVRKLANNLKIQPLIHSNVISVRYQSRNPKAAAEVLDALASAYTEKHLQLHRSSGEFTFFDQQVEQYKKSLDLAQDNLTAFTRQTGVVSAELQRDSSLREAADFDSSARQAMSAIADTDQRVRSLESQLTTIKPRMTTIVRTSDNPQVLGQLKSTLLTLELKRTELLTKYEPGYRTVLEVQQQIEDTKTAIQSEESKPLREESSDRDPTYLWVQSELSKARADLNGLRARAKSDEASATQYRSAAERLDQSELQQQELLRAAKTAEDNYLLYIQKREEARISNALDQRGILNVAIAEQPVVPSIPNRSPFGVSVLALLLAGTLGVSVAFTLDFFDPSFRTPDELASYLGAPVLASLPKKLE
jgi:uncharacterized protein involved in exopolysaccharide biosynthesis